MVTNAFSCKEAVKQCGIKLRGHEEVFGIWTPLCASLIPRSRSVTSWSEGWGVLLISASKWCDRWKCSRSVDKEIAACKSIATCYDQREEVVVCTRVTGVQPLWVWSSCLCNSIMISATVLKTSIEEKLLSMERAMPVLITALIPKKPAGNVPGWVTDSKADFNLCLTIPFSRSNIELAVLFSSGFLVADREADNFLNKKPSQHVLLVLSSSEWLCMCSVVTLRSAPAVPVD